jgi:hypothetical protein
MEEVHRGLPEKEFERPDGIVSVEVCRDSGLLPTELCRNDPRGSRVYTEYFVAGTQPTEECNVHQELEICKTSGMRAGPYCPPDTIETKIGIVRQEPINYEINPAASVKDAEFELTLEMREGPTCTVHLYPGMNTVPGMYPVDPSAPIVTDPTADGWWGNPTPTPAIGWPFAQPPTPTPIQLVPPPTPTPVSPDGATWPYATLPPEQIIDPADDE